MSDSVVVGARGRVPASGAGSGSGNPFLVGGGDTATPFSGTRLLDDGAQLKAAIENGDWLSAGLAGASGVMDAVSFAVNPLGGLVAMGVGWVLDHIEPLKSWLNDLTGDAGAVSGGAQTWGNIAAGLARAGADLTRSLDSTLATAESLAVDAYRRLASDVAAHLELSSQLAAAIGTGLQLASSIVQVVHDLVRDAIADVVGSAVSCLIPLPTTIADLIAKVAKWVTRLTGKLQALVRSFSKLDGLFARARGVMDDVAAAFRRIRSGAAHADDVPTTRVPGHAGEAPAARTPAGDVAANPSAASRASKDCVSGLDPVDLASGLVFIEKTDVGLPGEFPLVLRRRYVSGFRHGRWFGARWASTLDEHVDTAEGRLVLVRWDGSLLLFGAPDAEGVAVPVAGVDRWQLRRDGEGFVVTDPVGGVRHHFAGMGRRKWLVGQSDRAGRWVAFDRDATGAVSRVRHHGGYEVLVSADDSRVVGLAVAGAEADGGPLRLATFDYRHGSLVGETHGTDGTLHYEVDEIGRVVAWTDSNHVRYCYRYDETDRCTGQGTTNPGQQEVMRFALAYPAGPEPDGHTTVVTDPDGGQERWVVDGGGLVLAHTDATGATTRYEYDRWCRRTAVIDPLGHTSRFDWDDSSRLVRFTDPAGAATVVGYDDRGLPVRVVEPGGAATEYAWDGLGRRLALRDPSGAVTRWQRDPTGDATVVVVDPTGRRTRIDNDPAGLPLAIADPAGTTVLHRDALGRVTVSTDPVGGTTGLEWTPTGRLTARTGPDGAREQWSWDGEGNLVEAVDAAGRVTRYRYGPFDVLVEVVHADGSSLGFGYDAQRRPVSVTNANGATWQYHRDPAGRVVAETDYDGRRTSHTLDPAGRVIATTNPAGDTVTLLLDPAGRIVVREADGRRTEYCHDPAGRLLKATSDTSTLVREYDPAGRLVAETVDGNRTGYTLDAAGRILARTTPSGTVSAWELDAAGRRAGLEFAGHHLDLALDPLGRTVAASFAGGTISTGYDPVGRITHRATHPGGPASGPGWQVDYGYAPTGELLTATDSTHGTRQYQLDPVGRVTTILGTTPESYSYDPAGNLTRAAWHTPTTSTADDTAAQGSRTYHGTLLVHAGRDHYDHDTAGRVTRHRRALPSGGAKQWHYRWNSLNQLVAVTTPDQHTWDYRYDPLGRRTGKAHHDADGTLLETYRYTWDGPVLAEQTHTTPASGTTTTWEHDGFTPIAHHRTRALRPANPGALTPSAVDTEFAAIITDLVGTPLQLLDTTGHTTWTNHPTLWGTTTADPDMPLRFPGQYHDPETSLHYNLHRYYNPTTGRYLTPDPLGLTPSPNPHTYPTNPTSHIDPLGLESCPTVSGAPEGLADLAARRADLGAPPAGPGVSPTLSRLDVDGMTPLYGTSGHDQTVSLRVNPISRTHAETDVLQQLADLGGATGARATMYIDYPGGLCGACGRSGAVLSMARQVGLGELQVVWPGGSVVLRP